MIPNWSASTGLFTASLHSLQWAWCPLGCAEDRQDPMGYPPLWGHEAPQQPGQRMKVPGQSFLGPTPATTTAIGRPLSPPLDMCMVT